MIQGFVQSKTKSIDLKGLENAEKKSKCSFCPDFTMLSKLKEKY